MKFAAESITYRSAYEADGELLWRIFRDSMCASITAARAGVWDEQRERKQFFDQLDLSATQLILCDVCRGDAMHRPGSGGREPAGFFMLQSSADHYLLHTICIDPQFQNAGVGAHIVRSLQSQAAAEHRPLRLSVLKANPDARRLYERLGFAVRSETEHHIHMEWLS